jgi:AraC-like DNA-binding protein
LDSLCGSSSVAAVTAHAGLLTSDAIEYDERMGAVQMSARIGAMIVHAASAAGVRASDLQRATGFDPATAADPDARISLALEERLWNEAAQRSGDDDFGLHAAEAMRPGMFDVLDYVTRTAPTARAALERLARYNRLEHDVAVFSIIDAPDVTRVEHAFSVADVQCRHSAEFTLASIVVVGGQITGQPLRARAVEFRHAAPRTTREHARVFGAVPSFDARMNAIELDPAALARPVPAADPMLLKVIERHADAALAALPVQPDTTIERVRNLLAGALREGAASLASVAEQLHMSERSLQRRLAEENATFDSVLDELRHSLALRYLAERQIAISEVAYLVGYSEPSAFHRAFKRWTGSTPTELRRRVA